MHEHALDFVLNLLYFVVVLARRHQRVANLVGKPRRCRSILPARRGERLENGVGDLGLVVQHDPSVPLGNAPDPRVLHVRISSHYNSVSTGSPAARVARMSRIRWLREPRNFSSRLFSASRNGPSIR